MLESIPNQPDSNHGKYDPSQAALLWMQQQLAEQGITASPEEALKLFVQKSMHDARRGIQQDLAEQGINVSPDEAVTIQILHLTHLIMERTGPTDPHEAT
jgi:hypothetical protein